MSSQEIWRRKNGQIGRMLCKEKFEFENLSQAITVSIVKSLRERVNITSGCDKYCKDYM